MNLLLKPHWNAKNISAYTGFGLTKTYEVMAICRKRYGGTIPNEPSYITRDSVLAYLNTNVDREISIYKELTKKGG